MLNHFPPMMHIPITLPIPIQPRRQKLLPIIPSIRIHHPIPTRIRWLRIRERAIHRSGSGVGRHS